MKLVRLIAVASLIVGLSAFLPARANGQVLDHFKCYSARGQSVGASVGLKDQFDKEVESVTVLGPVGFCNPVQKLHDDELTPIENPRDHLTCYRFTPPSTKLNLVHAANQFGKEQLFVARARYLCVPSEKLTPPVGDSGG